MKKMEDGKATIREVYDTAQRLETKIDEIREVMNKTYVTKEDFALVKKDVAVLMQWGFWFTGVSAAVGAIFAFFADQIRDRITG